MTIESPSLKPTAHPGPIRRLAQFFKDLTIGTKLNLGFGLLVALSLMIIALSTLAEQDAAQRISQVSDLRVPLTLTSNQAQAALLRMLSSVRGYLILGDSQMLDEYQQANQTLQVNLAELKRLLEIEGEQADLEQMTQLETVYAAWEGLPEQLFTLHVNPIQNQPGLRLVRLELLQPSAAILKEIGNMQAAQKGRERAPDQLDLAQLITDFRTSFEIMDTNLRAYAISGDSAFKSAYLVQSSLNSIPWQSLSDNRDLLTQPQQNSLEAIAQARQKFLATSAQIFEAVEGEHANEALYLFKTEAVPRAQQMLAVLTAITAKEQADLKQQTSLAQQRLTEGRNQALIGGALAIMFGIILAMIFKDNIVGPVHRLTETAGQVIAGDLAIQAEVESQDEIGQLALNFNSMTTRLRQNITSLDKQRQQLSLVVEISRSLISILDLSDLLRQTVTLVKETFNFYHVHIYLLEEGSQNLILAAGYGEAGAEMKRRGHHIWLDSPKSLVAIAARTGQPVQVDDVRHDEEWLPNPLLPDTSSEVAAPIILGQRVVGVLDVQSSQVAGFDVQDVTIITIVAEQIAVALQNAQRFTETSRALAEAEKLQQKYIQNRWQSYLAERKTTNYQQIRPEAPPLEASTLAQVNQELRQGQMVVISRTDSISPEVEQPQSTIATPLAIRGQTIGSLQIHETGQPHRWSNEEIALVKAISEQMSLALENARLFDDTQRQAARERLAREITDKMRAAPDMSKIIQTGVTELANALGGSRAYVKIAPQLNPADQNLMHNAEIQTNLPDEIPTEWLFNLAEEPDNSNP